MSGEQYDSRAADTVKNLTDSKLIKVAEPCESLPSTVHFLYSTPPKVDAQGALGINIEIERYVNISRLPEPLRGLVKELLDVKS